MPEHSPAVEVICGVPVVATPTEIDATNADGLRAALLEASALGHGTFVLDMSGTQFCDSAGIHALVQAHKRSQSSGGAMLLVVFAPAVLRVFAIIGVDCLIPRCSSLEEALAQASAARSASHAPRDGGSAQWISGGPSGSALPPVPAWDALKNR